MASLPEAPEASTTIEWHPGQAFERIGPRVVLVHLVSCMKKTCGLSIQIMFLIILYLEGLFKPLTFQDVSFIENYYQVVGKTW